MADENEPLRDIDLPPTDALLRDDVKRLGALVGEILAEQVSADFLAQVEALRIDTHYDRTVIETMVQVVDDMAKAAKADVHLDVRELRPGMVLARAMVSSKGTTLLAAGHVFDERMVRQVQEFSRRESVRMSLWVQRASVPSDDRAAPTQGAQ